MDVGRPRSPLLVPSGSQVWREINTDDEEDSDFHWRWRQLVAFLVIGETFMTSDLEETEELSVTEGVRAGLLAG